MKYIKAYENIITDLFRKKLPKEVIDLGKKMTDFINNNIIGDYNADYSINYDYKSPILSIFINPNDFGTSIRGIGLYYNKDSQMLMIAFIIHEDFLKNIQEFIEKVIKNNYIDSRTHLTNISSGNNYFVTFEKIENVMNSINQKDYDLFLTAKNYNL
jgi:hypothetical protein